MYFLILNMSTKGKYINLSLEIPFYWVQYLLENTIKNSKIKTILSIFLYVGIAFILLYEFKLKYEFSKRFMQFIQKMNFYNKYFLQICIII